MTDREHVSVDARVLATLLAGAATLWVARVLPVHFNPPSNRLGIVSPAHLNGYPFQQEVFWYGFGLAVGFALAALGAAALEARLTAARAPITAFALAVLALVGGLASSATIALGLLVAAGLATAVSACREGRTPNSARHVAATTGSPPNRLAAYAGYGTHSAAWALGCAALAIVVNPVFVFQFWHVANGTPDIQLATNDWWFHSESGQHLAWTDALLRGGLPGRDFFPLYGPLYDLGLVASWSILGRSVAVWNLFFSLLNTLGLACVLGLGVWLFRRRWLALALLPFLGEVHLRQGLPFLGLLILGEGLRRGRRRLIASAGALAGVAALLSQEFAVAYVGAAAVVLAVAARRQFVVAFAVSALVVIASYLTWICSQGALVPFLSDLVNYPRYMLAGFGKIPFPALIPALPMAVVDLVRGNAARLLLGYAVPATYAGALLLLLPAPLSAWSRPVFAIHRLRAMLVADPRRVVLLALIVFGIVGFRVALGRSSDDRTLSLDGPAALLVLAGIDALWAREQARPLAARVALSAGLAAWLWIGGFAPAGVPRAAMLGRITFQCLELIRTHRLRAVADPTITAVLAWVDRNVPADEPIFFLPNHASYYYLTGRPMPTRFALSHQMVTAAHRTEALRALAANPPSAIVWHRDGIRLDGISDETYLGAPMVEWIRARYGVTERIGAVDIYLLRGASRAER